MNILLKFSFFPFKLRVKIFSFFLSCWIYLNANITLSCFVCIVSKDFSVNQDLIHSFFVYYYDFHFKWISLIILTEEIFLSSFINIFVSFARWGEFIIGCNCSFRVRSTPFFVAQCRFYARIGWRHGWGPPNVLYFFVLRIYLVN